LDLPLKKELTLTLFCFNVIALEDTWMQNTLKKDSNEPRRRNPKGSLTANTKTITVRIPEYAFNNLSRLAKRADSTLADSVRESVIFYVLPEMNDRQIKDFFLTDLKSEADHFENYRLYLSNALRFCEEVAKLHEQLKKEKERLDQVEGECLIKLEKLIGRSGVNPRNP
jgi:hypothetical protein